MPDIKTKKENKGTIKTLDKAKIASGRIMNVAISRKITETATQKRRSKRSSVSLILKFRGTETANMNLK